LEFLLFLAMLSRKLLTFGKSISLAMDNEGLAVDDKYTAASPLSPVALFFRLLGIWVVVKQ
jgi:hypothetical protein